MTPFCANPPSSGGVLYNDIMKSYNINKELIVQSLDKETVIFDGTKSILFTLNETASYIFRKLKAKVPTDRIAVLLAKNFEVTEKQAKKDIRELIVKLAKKKILV